MLAWTPDSVCHWKSVRPAIPGVRTLELKVKQPMKKGIYSPTPRAS